MLLQEEQYIIHWLTEYGALTKTQVVRMLKDKPPQTAEKIIRGLKRDVLLYDISGQAAPDGGEDHPGAEA